MSGRVLILHKDPAEIRRIAMSFAGIGAIVGAGAVQVEARGDIGGAAMTAEAALSNGLVMLTLAGGTDGDRYLVTVTATDDAGQTIESEADISVINATWAMPDGGAPYLSIAEFVDRFGLPEVIAATDGTGDGRIDRAMLVAALTDAQSIVEAHLSGRYALPLSTVPQIVKTLLGDLARERLYPGGAPDGVAKAGQAALRMLAQLSAGTLSIGAAETPAASSESDAPILSFSGGRTYPDNLQRFR